MKAHTSVEGNISLLEPIPSPPSTVPLLGLEGVALSPCNKMLHLRNLSINLEEKKREGGLAIQERDLRK